MKTNVLKKDRNHKIMVLFINGYMIHSDIAKQFNVTRERVRQILNFYLNKEEFKEITERNRKKKLAKARADRPITICKACDKQITRYSIWCWDCQVLVRTIRTPKEKKEVQRIASRNWQENNKEKVKANQRIYRQLPKVKALQTARARKRYYEIKNDPVRYAELLAKARKYNNKRYTKTPRPPRKPKNETGFGMNMKVKYTKL